MEIVWLAKRNLDASIDRITWIEMALQLKSKGHKVYLVTTSKKDKPSFGLDGSIEYLPASKIRIISFLTSIPLYFFFICYRLYKKKPHVVIFHPDAIFAVLPFVLLRKLQVIHTRLVLDIRTVQVEVFGVREKIKEGLVNSSVAFSKFLFDGLTVITPFMRKVFSEKYDLKHNDIGVWSSGVSLDVFNPKLIDDSMKGELLQSLNLKNKFIIMYHGVFTPSRGLNRLIEAINLLRKIYPDLVLLLLGNGNDRINLEKLVDSLSLHERVTIKGPVPHASVPSYIALADVGILPFPSLLWWRVSSPIKLMEYLAMEKPVILSEIEAHRDVIGSSRCGFFVKSNQPEELAKGISLAYKNRKNLIELGKEGRTIVEERFTWEKQADVLDKYLKDVC